MRVEQKNRAKDLIEDFMIASNGVYGPIPDRETIFLR
jgi:hypothetical protein